VTPGAERIIQEAKSVWMPQFNSAVSTVAGMPLEIVDGGVRRSLGTSRTRRRGRLTADSVIVR
jgi:hypothetical protein